MQQKAKIIERNAETIICQIQCADACHSCSAKKFCASNSDQQNLKTITLLTANPSHKVGDVITIEVSTSVGLKAVMVAYLIPVFLIIGLLLVLQQYGLSDLTSGSIVLGVAALYFLSIKLFGWTRSISVEIVDDQPFVDQNVTDDDMAPKGIK